MAPSFTGESLLGAGMGLQQMQDGGVG